MHALIVAPQPFFSARGTPFSVYYRTAVMAELGVTADLLTYGEGEDVDIPGVRIVRIPRFRWLGRVRTGPSIFKLFLDVFVMLRMLSLLMTRRYDFVHAHEEAVFFSRYFKYIFRYKLAYDMHSSLPQQLTNFSFTKSKLIHKLFKWQEDGAIKQSEAIIAICDDLADYVKTINPDPEKLLLIENSIFDPVRLKSSEPERARGGPTTNASPFEPQTNDRLVVYAGTLEHYQGIDLLIPAFRQVIDEHPDAFLLIVGGTPKQVADFRALGERCGISERCHFTGQLAQSHANEYVKKAEIVLSPRSEGTNTPLKIYQQLAGGVPLVATNIYSHTQVLDDNVAILVDPSADGLATGIKKALSDPSFAKQVAGRAQSLYDEKYARRHYVAKMQKFLALLA